jgi:RsiW-degrading membrane proteinase PrsW (M82 family)
VLGPFVILILELVLLIGVGILAILWVMTDPILSNQLNGLAFRLQSASPDINAILNILLPFLLNPGVLLLGFAFISVLVPVIEETLKPIGVWFLAGQKITPAQGFGYGVISGAGFGLFENLGNTSGGGEAWALLAAARIATLLLHCFTAALVGWALASAWSQRRYLRLGVTFAIAVLVHGLWNGMAVLSAASSLQGVSSISIPASLQQLGALSDVGIITLGILVFVLYIGFNTVLRRNTLSVSLPPPSDGGAPIPHQSNPQSPQDGGSLLTTFDINASFPVSAGNNAPMPESESNHQVPGENPPTTPENNP